MEGVNRTEFTIGGGLFGIHVTAQSTSHQSYYTFNMKLPATYAY